MSDTMTEWAGEYFALADPRPDGYATGGCWEAARAGLEMSVTYESSTTLPSYYEWAAWGPWFGGRVDTGRADSLDVAKMSAEIAAEKMAAEGTVR